jgi:hypothetical protein
MTTNELPMLKNEFHYKAPFFDLTAVKADFLSIIGKAPGEVPYLRLAVIEGRIDGSEYYGECACLKGTLAGKAAGPLFNHIDSPSAFIALAYGIKCNIAAVVLDWLDEFLVGERAGKPQLVAAQG